MPTLRTKITCHISANCEMEDSHELSSKEWKSYQKAKAKGEGHKWIAENLIDPEFLHNDVFEISEDED